MVSTTLAEQFVENEADVDDDRDQEVELGRGKRMRSTLDLTSKLLCIWK